MNQEKMIIYKSLLYKIVMKKQKFRPYEEPIFRKPMLPLEKTFITRTSIKSKTHQIRTSHSMHKKPQHILSKYQILKEPKMILLEDERSKTCFMKQTPLRPNLPIDIFLNKEFEPICDHTSLRKIPPIQIDKLSSSQIRRTITVKSTKSKSDKKIHTSTFLSIKDQKMLKIKNFTASPYLKNISDVSKIMKMLQPVNGPNASIRKQILQHNEQNKKNHELVVMRKTNQTFEQKRQTYLERIGLKANSKVFIMNSRDQHIREALIKKGWIELQDISDGFYHLKWVYSDNSNDYANLSHSQLFNHFYNNQELTNKNNLRKNIKAAKPQARPLIPLTFDLGIAKEFRNFTESATLFEGIKILNLIKNTLQQYDQLDYKKIISNPNYFKYQNRNTLVKTASRKQETKIFKWLGIQHYKDYRQMQILIQHCIELICFLAKRIQRETEIQYSIFNVENIEKKSENILSVFDYFQSLAKSYQNIELLLGLPKFLKVQLIKMHFHFNNFKKLFIKSYGYQNSWIIKPTGVSRGSGIYIESDYKKLTTQANNQHGRIVQKYIQKPFLLSDTRKFDLRQWVLVRSFEPLEVYMYHSLYGRICPQKYTQNDFQNIQKHLTNYSLSKQHYKSKNGPIAINTQQIDDPSLLFNHMGMKKMPSASIILEQNLRKHIDESSNKKSWHQIKLQIKLNIILTLKACSNGITQNPNCFEVYGFDILLDEELNVFVIEVNLSPACEKRQGLQVYLEQMSHALVDLTQIWLNLKKNDSQNDRSEVWEILDERIIKKQLHEIKAQKMRNQKAITIQKWIRQHIIDKR